MISGNQPYSHRKVWLSENLVCDLELTIGQVLNISIFLQALAGSLNHRVPKILEAGQVAVAAAVPANSRDTAQPLSWSRHSPVPDH